MNPAPPSTLNKETIRVWHGWGNIGDKEVARESAAKGSHVNLAITFLSLRKKLKYEDAQIWFQVEIIKWVHELLERRQIFKASHVLNNIAVDPGNEFVKIFYKTKNKDLREYIGNHLIKMEQLSENMRQLWFFLNLILENADILKRFKLEKESLECLDTLPDNLKSEIAVILFLKTEDSKLNIFLNGEILWKHLVEKNDLNNLVTWINIRHNSNSQDLPEGNLIDQFKKHPITNNMIDLVSNLDLDITKDTIFNELSKFGIFQNKEKDNFILILERLINSYSLANLYDILEKNPSVLNTEYFLQLLIDYCVENKHFLILNECLRKFEIPPTRQNERHVKLIREFRFLVNNFNEVILSKNILNVSKNLLAENIESYFKDNSIIFLSFLFFNQEIDFTSAILKRDTIIIENLHLDNCIHNLLQNYRILHEIVAHKITGNLKSELTLYNLITIHQQVDSKILLKFRFTENDLTNFYTEEIIKFYGYSKKLDFKFYLKESRPSFASKLFNLNQIETFGSFNEDEQQIVDKKIRKLALTNFDCDEISSSCVCYLEMIGRGSLKIRVLNKVSKILKECGFDNNSIFELLNNEDEPYKVQNILENLLVKKIDSESAFTGFEITEIFKTYEIIVQFSKLNNIKLPETFLRFCAGHNFWLAFLLIAQIYEYPLDQIKLLIQFFKSPNMLEHLTHGVVNDIKIEEKNVLIRERDSRNYLLSKVGVRKTTDVLNQLTSASLKSQSSLESGTSSCSSDFFEIDISNIKATLLQTLIRCHNSTDPPKALLQACQLYRNPLLAILATSYEPDSLVTNWLTWLAVSCGLYKIFTNYETTAMSANAVTNLLENCMNQQFPKTILESFEIFLPENPLKVFLEFLINLINLNFNNTLLVSQLTIFESQLNKNARKNSIITETDHEMTYLTNKTWIELTGTKLLAGLLEHNCKSLYEQILIIENLCTIEIWKHFSCDLPNFRNLVTILKALYYSSSVIYLNLTLIFDMKTNREAIVLCINELLEKHEYKVALQVAQVENLPPDLILIKEWQNKMSERRDQFFWDTCNENLEKYEVTADCVVDFYLDCSEMLIDLLEKFILLKFAWNWSTKFDLSCQYEIEKKMWLAFLLLEDKHKNFEYFNIKPMNYLYRDLTESLKNVTVYEGELNKDFMNQLEKIIAFVLNKNDFWLALKIQKIFNCKSPDLETLKLCHSLAEGILLPHQLNAQQRLLLSNVTYLRTYSHRRTFLSTKLPSYSSSSHSPANSLQIQTVDGVDSYMNDTLAIIKLLSEHLHSGIEIGQTVFMNYRISINIEIPYQVIVMTTDYMKILKDALEDNCMNKLDVVHDFIVAYKWSKHEVADFICGELVNATINFIESNLDHMIMWDLNLDQDFQLILQLLQDCSSLGYKIYSYASTLHKSQVESSQSFKISDLSLIIELLIRAHDCFTADCNMEGISGILKKSKEVISNLLVLQDWKLMVRLLTGVGRYTEMNYVFQILNENDQFEFLLRKGFRKDSTLKVALLEYLKKYCPDNKDLYKIVALHFALFSEVALLWEREAQNIIKNLISISILEMQNNKLIVEEEPFILFQNNESTKICLNKAMENYIHATDFHLQGEKLTKATNSAQQAEVIALQLSFLNRVAPNESVICLLSLKRSQLVQLISSILNFEESWILVESYNFHPDWSSVLYEQYILKNNSTFLDGFLKHLPLTDTLVHDISRKFIVSNINSVNEIKCMKYILNRLSSIHAKYRIASELGFTDLLEDLISSGQLVYLKDTVWKKGYKN